MKFSKLVATTGNSWCNGEFLSKSIHQMIIDNGIVKIMLDNIDNEIVYIPARHIAHWTVEKS